MHSMLDEKDVKILSIIQADARIANVEIARRVGLAPSAVLERLRKLERTGVISAYEARIAPDAIGQGLMAFIFVRAAERVAATKIGERLARIPEVLEVHSVAGEDCYLVKVRTADTGGLTRLLREKFGAVAEIQSTRTTIVLDTLKETALLPIGGSSGRR